ncbi:transposase [Spirosoma humi]
MAPLNRLKRKRKHDLRPIMNIILWLPRTGAQWRNLPEEWPIWQGVYYCLSAGSACSFDGPVKISYD